MLCGCPIRFWAGEAELSDEEVGGGDEGAVAVPALEDAALEDAALEVGEAEAGSTSIHRSATAR